MSWRELCRRARSTTIGARDRERANIILLRLDGVGVEAVAERLKTTPKRVSLWSGRFETLGLAGLDDKPGRGRKAIDLEWRRWRVSSPRRRGRRKARAAGVFVR